jgi:hypothetical protein
MGVYWDLAKKVWELANQSRLGISTTGRALRSSTRIAAPWK